MKFIATTSLLATLGVAAALPAPPPGTNFVVPTSTSQYNVWNGATTFDTGVGEVFKDGKSPDITTLVAFDIPAAAAGKTCRFRFLLSPAATVTGSGEMDVFSTFAPPTHSTVQWPPNNNRNQELGRLIVSNDNVESTYSTDIPAVGFSYPCPAPGPYGIELVGVNDEDYISWSDVGMGALISWV
jgi:hypothetical protein